MDSRRSSHTSAGFVAALALAAALSGVNRAAAGEPVRFAARSGLDIATAGAHTWATDARLIYVENDGEVDSSGTSDRWGYLFYSPTLDKARAYSVRDGKIVTAENLEMKFEAPPLAEGWMDSREALLSAEKDAGLEFKQKHGAHLSTMLLVRGVFQDGDPDLTTWAFVYAAPDGPSLFVVVDAASGRVRRTWRG